MATTFDVTDGNGVKRTITIVNEKREIPGSAFREGFGEYATRHASYEIKCVDCGKWTAEYGEVSVVLGDNEEGWICPDCIAQLPPV